MEDLINIRRRLEAYVSEPHDIGYKEFREWFVPVYAEHVSAGDSDALKFCRAIEWALADYSEALITIDQLKQLLVSLLYEANESETSVPFVKSVRIAAISGIAHALIGGNSTGTEWQFPSASGSFLPTGTIGRPVVERRS